MWPRAAALREARQHKRLLSVARAQPLAQVIFLLLGWRARQRNLDPLLSDLPGENAGEFGGADFRLTR